MIAISVGISAPSSQPERRDAALEEAAEERLTGRVGRVGDDRQAPAGDRAFHDRGLQAFAEVGHERAR